MGMVMGASRLVNRHGSYLKDGRKMREFLAILLLCVLTITRGVIPPIFVALIMTSAVDWALKANDL